MCDVWNNQIKMLNCMIQEFCFFALKKPLIRFVQVECEGLTDCPIKIAPAEKDAERKANTQASGGTNPKKRGERGVCGGLDAFRPHQELGYLNCALTLTNAERSNRIRTII